LAPPGSLPNLPEATRMAQPENPDYRPGSFALAVPASRFGSDRPAVSDSRRQGIPNLHSPT